MKKNILIVVLILSNLIFIVYAFIKADESERAGIEANAQRQEAIKLKDEAVEQADRAMKSQIEATNQKMMADQLRIELEKCQSR